MSHNIKKFENGVLILNYSYRKRKRRRVRVVLIFSAIFLGIVIWLIFKPNNTNEDFFGGKEFSVVFDGTLSRDVLERNREKYISLDIVKQSIDKYIWVDKGVKLITITDKNGIKRFSPDGENIIDTEGSIFFSISFLEEIYGKVLNYNEENNTAVIINDELSIGIASALKDTVYMRSAPTVKSPRFKVWEEKKGQEIGYVIYAGMGKDKEWVKVMAFTGETGFIKISEIEISSNSEYTGEFCGVNTGEPGSANETQSIKDFKDDFKNKKISMVWEAVYSKNPDVSQIGEMKGLNVVAPTWLEFSDEYGNSNCKADMGYVLWAGERGFYIWGTVTNNFKNPDITSKMLADHDTRRKCEDTIINFALTYGLDGINIDFENMYESDKELFTQFMRELSALCRENGLIVSCDVTPLSSSSNWSLCYDRKALSEALDYICVMLYDQHYDGGDAGSVAQLSWAEESIINLLQEIPADKFIMSIPFYTRLWEERTQENGSVEVLSKVLSMEESEKWVKDNGVEPSWDEESGQYYGELKKDDCTYKIWIEDESSVAGRIALLKEYGLAGMSGWRRGFEMENIWDTIYDGLNG